MGTKSQVGVKLFIHSEWAGQMCDGFMPGDQKQSSPKNFHSVQCAMLPIAPRPVSRINSFLAAREKEKERERERERAFRGKE